MSYFESSKLIGFLGEGISGKGLAGGRTFHAHADTGITLCSSLGEHGVGCQGLGIDFGDQEFLSCTVLFPYLADLNLSRGHHLNPDVRMTLQVERYGVNATQRERSDGASPPGRHAFSDQGTVPAARTGPV